MSRLNVVIVALCAFAAGLGAALIVVSIQSESMQDVITDRDNQVLLLADQTRRANESLRLLKKLRYTSADLQADLRAKADRSRDVSYRLAAYSLKANVFIALLIDYPKLRTVLLTPPISDSFEGEDGWFYPQTAIESLGAQWLAKELVADGLFRQADIDAADVFKAADRPTERGLSNIDALNEVYKRLTEPDPFGGMRRER